MLELSHGGRHYVYRIERGGGSQPIGLNLDNSITRLEKMKTVDQIVPNKNYLKRQSNAFMNFDM